VGKTGFQGPNEGNVRLEGPVTRKAAPFQFLRARNLESWERESCDGRLVGLG
jgi:hypothetical protein